MSANIFGVIATISSLCLNLLGMPSQIIKHYKEKKVGITALFVILALSAHICWFLYGLNIKSIYLMITQGVGCLLSGTIFVQKFFVYRKNAEAQ